MVSAWRDWVDDMDGMVDDYFAEPVELHPWTGSSYTEGGGPDTTRSIVKTDACYVTPGAASTGEARAGGTAAVSEQDVWMSIQQHLLGDITQWRAGDRVYWPERDEWYEMNKPPLPSATLRPNVPLIRIAG